MIRSLLLALGTSLIGVIVLATPLHAQDKTDSKRSVVAQTTEWQTLKTLVGQWEGVVDEGGKSVAATLEVRMTGDGSAIMHVMGKDTPDEMVTMFHQDGKRLLATHYCAEHNQPRMALLPAKESNLVPARPGRSADCCRGARPRTDAHYLRCGNPKEPRGADALVGPLSL